MEYELSLLQLTEKLSFAWIIPIAPLFSAFILLIIGHKLPKIITNIIACLGVLVSTIIGYIVTWHYFLFFIINNEKFQPITVNKIIWLRFCYNLDIHFGVFIDSLSLLIVIVVCTISFLVHLYSTGYMLENEKRRFFIYFNLFTTSMLGLVIAPNILQTFFFWELVGATSFLLIGFYYKKNSAKSAAKKAFIITRFADLGFLIGILIIGYLNYTYFNDIKELIYIKSNILLNSDLHPLSFVFINNPDVINFYNNLDINFIGIPLLSLATFLIFIGACGKSAMFPLHVWLPDAMEGPTPVSALIHAATMVVAGIFLVARLINLFIASEYLITIVLYTGLGTAFLAALMACVQVDIKRILAFSTISQLGYMMIALGLSTKSNLMGYSSSMFHLFTHAFFKALLFLAAGAIIHISHSNNIWHSKKFLKNSIFMKYIFLIATCAITGIPPFSGFFSKDHILIVSLMDNNYFIFIITLFIGLLTSFYMFRLYFILFINKKTDDIINNKTQVKSKIPIMMSIPMIILAMASCFTGFLPIEKFVSITSLKYHEYKNIENIVIPMAITSSIIGIIVAWFIYIYKNITINNILNTKIFLVVSNILYKRLYIDYIYIFFAKKIMFITISKPVAWVDKHIVDKIVDISGKIIKITGEILLLLQTGHVQLYATWFVIGFIIISISLN